MNDLPQVKWEMNDLPQVKWEMNDLPQVKWEMLCKFKQFAHYFSLHHI